MLEQYRTVYQGGESEIVEKKSRFIATVRLVKTEEEALKFIPKEKIWLNPDCGFATFSNRPVSTFEIIEKKLEQLQIAKNALREKYE